MTLLYVPKEPPLLHLPPELEPSSGASLLKVHQNPWEGHKWHCCLSCCHHEALILLGLLGEMQSIPSSPCPAEHQERQRSRDTATAPAVRQYLPAKSSTSRVDLLPTRELCKGSHREQSFLGTRGADTPQGTRSPWVSRLCPAVSVRQGNHAGCGSCGNKEEAGAAQPPARS